MTAPTGVRRQAGPAAGGGGQAQVGSTFGLPGITRYTEQFENNDGTTVTLSQTAQTPVNTLIPFKQTDVIVGWELAAQVTNTTAAGTQTITASKLFPYNFLNAGTLTVQNQYDTLKWTNGLDLAIRDIIRPLRNGPNFGGVSTIYSLPAFSSYSNQVNLITANTYTPSSTPINLKWELPAAVWMDRFYPLTASGAIAGPAVRGFVSPQFMGGTARIIQPTILWSAAFVTTSDAGPYTISGPNTTPATFSGSVRHRIKRKGFYQPVGQADSPVIYNWQYIYRCVNVSLSGVTTKDLIIPLNAQILSVTARFFDPNISSPVGGPLVLNTNLLRDDLLFGSGLYWAQDREEEAQYRIIQQHDFLFQEGVLVWDLAMDESAGVTNARSLNTYNTAGIQLHFDFAAALSSSAYVVLCIEGLTYVEVA